MHFKFYINLIDIQFEDFEKINEDLFHFFTHMIYKGIYTYKLQTNKETIQNQLTKLVQSIKRLQARNQVSDWSKKSACQHS